MKIISRNLLLLGFVSTFLQIISTAEITGLFSPKLNISQNIELDKFEKETLESDFLMFIFIYDSMQDKSIKMIDQVINPLVEDLNDALKVYTFDCQNPQIAANKQRFFMCGSEDHVPYIQMLLPNEIKINTTKNEYIPPKVIQYNDTEVSINKLYSFVNSNIPVYAVNITNMSTLEEFLYNKEDKDINKVVYMLARKKLPNEFKALTAAFKDRLKFGFIHKDLQENFSEFKEIAFQYPSIYVYRTYDMKNKRLARRAEWFKMDKKEVRFNETRDYLSNYARRIKKPPVDPNTQKNEANPQYVTIHQYSKFKDEILGSEQACLVYFLIASNFSKEDISVFQSLIDEVYGAVKIAVYLMDNTDEGFLKIKLKLKLSNTFPQLRFYKNNIFDKEKIKTSFDIMKYNDLESILEEVHSGMDYEIRQVTEKLLNSVSMNYAIEEKKNALTYFYNEGRISIHFKAIAAQQFLKDDFVFLSVQNPSKSVLDNFQLKNIPGIGGTLAAKEEDADKVDLFIYGGKITYDEILSNLLKLSKKEQAYQEMQKIKPQYRIRNFEEIQNQSQFEQKCTMKKIICAVAFLKAEDGSKKHGEDIQLLRKAEQLAQNVPVHYMWINATCHSYLLKEFNVDTKSLPLIVYLNPENEKISQYTGKMDATQVKRHHSKVYKGKVDMFQLNKKLHDINIQTLNCGEISELDQSIHHIEQRELNMRNTVDLSNLRKDDL